MRVLSVHFRAGMSCKLLPDFLRDARIRHSRDETVSETVKAQAGLRTSFAVGFTQQSALNLGVLHDALKGHRQSTLAAASFTGQRWKHRCFTDAASLFLEPRGELG